MKKVSLALLGWLCLCSVIAFAASNKGNIVKPGDILEIQVWNNEDLNRTVEVTSKGTFTFPFIGQVKAAGISVTNLENLLKEKLADGYLINPQVTIRVTKYKSQPRFFVIGKVEKPGEYTWEQGLTVRQAIGLAGGAASGGALNRVKIFRLKNGAEKEIKPNMSDLVRQGDIITVPESYF